MIFTVMDFQVCLWNNLHIHFYLSSFGGSITLLRIHGILEFISVL